MNCRRRQNSLSCITIWCRYRILLDRLVCACAYSPSFERSSPSTFVLFGPMYKAPRGLDTSTQTIQRPSRASRSAILEAGKHDGGEENSSPPDAPSVHLISRTSPRVRRSVVGLRDSQFQLEILKSGAISPSRASSVELHKSCSRNRLKKSTTLFHTIRGV